MIAPGTPGETLRKHMSTVWSQQERPGHPRQLPIGPSSGRETDEQARQANQNSYQLRRLNAPGTLFGERAVLKLMFALLVRTADRWRGIGISEFRRRQFERLRDPLVSDPQQRSAPAVAPFETPSQYPAERGLDYSRRIQAFFDFLPGDGSLGVTHRKSDQRMLEFRSLTKHYSSGILAVADVSLKVDEGVLGLLGPNGAGKTTLLSMLATVTRPTSGTFLFDGRDGVADPRFVRSRLGYLPQDFGVYEKLTTREFLSYLARLKGLAGSDLRRALANAMELTNLHGLADRRLKGFSGGMRQRVGIAQALLGDPRLVIVDEPTVGLDPVERIRFRNLLSEIAHGRIVIFSTHVISDLESVATQVAVLRKGKLLIVASPEELLARAQGHVFSLITSSDRLDHVRSSVRVSALVRRPDGVHVRFVGAAPCFEGAVVAEPTLEDAYLMLDTAVDRT